MGEDRPTSFFAASEFAESSASLPGQLRFYADYDTRGMMREATKSIVDWLRERDQHAATLSEYRDELSAASDDVVEFDGTTYPNAHEAALDIQKRLLGRIQMWLFHKGNDREAAMPHLPLDPALIESNWQLVRAVILAFPLVNHSALAARVARERAKMLTGFEPTIAGFAAPEQPFQNTSGTAGDLIWFSDIAQLANVDVKTVQNVVSIWRKAEHVINDPCSYATVQPLCIAKWKGKAAMFPPHFADMKAILTSLD